MRTPFIGALGGAVGFVFHNMNYYAKKKLPVLVGGPDAVARTEDKKINRIPDASHLRIVKNCLFCLFTTLQVFRSVSRSTEDARSKPRPHTNHNGCGRLEHGCVRHYAVQVCDRAPRRGSIAFSSIDSLGDDLSCTAATTCTVAG